MATPSASHDGNSSDYGSDFTAEEEQILDKLLASAAELAHGPKPTITASNDTEDLTDVIALQLQLRDVITPEPDITATDSPRDKALLSPVQTRGHGVRVIRVESPESRQERRELSPSNDGAKDTPQDAAQLDLRSPLERFRTKPKKPLSVTDLVSTSWCELQYWYTLTKHGKKRRTPAMRQGSVVHRALEDQVHRTVKVSVKSKEDAFGLRIMNVMQGLKTLRDTGITRELEVWGSLDGQVINGIIDELSYICPDKDLEKEPAEIPLPPDQALITDFTESGSSAGLQRGTFNTLRSMQKRTEKIYICDVKTRGHKSIPKGASFRPTLYQLMLYHQLLSNLATNRIDFSTIASRYDLDPDRSFSDSFIAQVGSMNQNYHDAPSDPSQAAPSDPSQAAGFPDSSQDSMDILLENNSLRQLWVQMIAEFQRTMPKGVDSFGKVLKVEYRDRADGSVLGIKTFLHDDRVINEYIDAEMEWWRGQREAVGVCIEEAYKCGSCDFQDTCEWRLEKIKETTEKHRTRTRSEI